MKINVKNIKNKALRWVNKYENTTDLNKMFLIDAFIAGFINSSKNTLPTHFRFKNAKRAAFWGCTTKEWLQIETILGDSLSTYDFAWVNIADVEFKVDTPTKCLKCKINKVTRINDICEECQEEYESN